MQRHRLRCYPFEYDINNFINTAKTVSEITETTPYHSAYPDAEKHTMNKSSNSEESQMDSYSYTTTHKNKQVNVILEFPKQTDHKAEQEFISRLKELYLEKIKLGACTSGKSALSSLKIKETEDSGNG